MTCCHQSQNELLFSMKWSNVSVMLVLFYWEIKCGFANLCKLFLLTRYTASQLFWNWGCR